jgi:hypothetical protein
VAEQPAGIWLTLARRQESAARWRMAYPVFAVHVECFLDIPDGTNGPWCWGVGADCGGDTIRGWAGRATRASARVHRGSNDIKAAGDKTPGLRWGSCWPRGKKRMPRG